MDGPEPVWQVLKEVLDKPKENDTTPAPYLTIEEMTAIPNSLTFCEVLNYGFKYPLSPKPIKCEYCNLFLRVFGRRSFVKREILGWYYGVCNCESSTKARQEEQQRIENENNLKMETERQRQQQERIQKLFDQSRLGARFMNRTLESFEVNNENRLAYEGAKRYISKFAELKKDGIGINFNGSLKGAGKTHLAAAITIALINQGVPVIMGTVVTLLGKLKESYQLHKSEQEIIDLYSTVDLLVIDDIGRHRVNEWVLEKLFEIINNRYENNLPIIITMNHDIKQLTERLTIESNHDTAEAITSRLWEMCRGIEMNYSKDRRKE